MGDPVLAAQLDGVDVQLDGDSSMIRSIANVASGRPAPRYASVNVVLVNTPTHSNRYAGTL